MDKTKSAIKDFMGKSGQKDTTVHETINPSVKRETVRPTQHEEVHTAVDKEVHQDHYHHTVQPIKDKEVLPEQHHHKVGAVENREVEHRDHEGTKHTLATENQKFKDERVVRDTEHTQSHAPTAGGENVHHHFHETIQPVMEKEVIQPHVVHTVVPVHEVHHNTAQHHSTSELPPINMEEYKQQGGALGGRGERSDAFDGEPENIGSRHFLDGKGDSGFDEPHQSTRGRDHRDREGRAPGTGSAVDGQRSIDSEPSQVGTSQVGSSRNGTSHNGTSHNGTSHSGTSHDGREHRDGESGSTGAGHGHIDSEPPRKEKPGLLNKLNPKTDSNGDGKAGFMK